MRAETLSSFFIALSQYLEECLAHSRHCKNKKKICLKNDIYQIKNHDIFNGIIDREKCESVFFMK